MRFVLGLLVGLTALAGYVAFERYESTRDPCLGRCGAKTRCVEGRCVAQRAPRRRRTRGPSGRRKRRRRSEPEAKAPRTPTAAQLRQVVKGAALRRADVIDMTEDADNAPELSQEAITARVRRIDSAVVACIDEAREDYALPGVRIELRFRVERAGMVSGVRIDAPALMHDKGLYRCVSPLVRGLRFPRSSAAVVATYPYSVH